MKKKSVNRVLVLLLTGLVLLTFTSQVSAFEPVSFGDTELTVYGFLRNNYGYFLEDQDYANNDDKLATNRTWLRLNFDYQITDDFSLFASTQFVYEPEYDIEEGSVSEDHGKEYSEYNDLDDVLREAYFDWAPTASTSFRVGRQIVIWGESLTSKVGDVVNPEDTRFTFAFANWEDTRIPQWMVKGLHDFEQVATSVEWLVSPNLTGDEHRVNRSGEYAIPSAGEYVSQRFAIHPEDRFLAPYSVNNPALGSPGGETATSPFSRGWMYNPVFIPGTGWAATEVPNVIHQHPDEDDVRFGFRTSTFLNGYEFGVSYFHTQVYDPVVKRSTETTPTGWGPGLPANYRNYYLVHPDIDYFGAYVNKDLPVGIFRAEAIYAPNKSFGTFDTSDFDAITEEDYFKYMIAWDLNGLFYFDWHKSAPFDLTIEHVGEFVPDNEYLQNVIYGEQVEEYNPSVSARFSTNWFYGILETEIVISYGFNNNDGLIMPVVKWNPVWQDQAFSAELRYINIFGDSKYENLGMFKEKDMVVLTLQYNF